MVINRNNQTVSAKTQLKLPVESVIFLYGIDSNPQQDNDLLSLLFSFSIISQSGNDNFYLYMITEEQVTRENITIIAEQTAILNISNRVFFNFNPPAETKRLIFAATDYMLTNYFPEKSNLKLKTTFDGQYLLEGLTSIKTGQTEEKLFSKALLQKLLTQALPGCYYHQLSHLKKEPVVFYYTLFLAATRKLIGADFTANFQEQKQKYYTAILNLYCHTLQLKKGCHNALNIVYPDNDRRLFIEPFVNIILADLSKVCTCSPFTFCLSQLLQPFVDEIDACFLQSLALLGRDTNHHSMRQKDLLKRFSPAELIKTLINTYPCYSLLAIRNIRHHLRHAKQFIGRLKKDWSLLTKSALRTHPVVRLTNITFLSDRAYYGAIALHINKKPALVYKPRNLSMESRICGCSMTSCPKIPFSLAEWFNLWHKERIIMPLTFFCMQDERLHHYGYVTYIQRESHGDYKIKAQRLGQLSFFALLCGLCDLHDANVFFCHDNSIALTDSKYSFSPLIIGRLSHAMEAKQTIRWETSALEATRLKHLWEPLPDYTLTPCSVMLNNNGVIEFKHKSACVIKKYSHPLFNMTAEHLPVMEQGFSSAWNMAQKHINTLQSWFKHCETLTTYRILTGVVPLSLYQHTMMTCSAFYSPSLNYLYQQTWQYLENIFQHSFCCAKISRQQRHQQTIHCLHNQPFLFCEAVDIDLWIVMLKKLFRKGKSNDYKQKLYVQPLKDWLFNK